MPQFSLTIPHELPVEQARARLGRAQAKLETDYGARCTWESEHIMRVERKGLDARVVVEGEQLVVDVKMGLLLTPLMGSIREGITKKLTRLMSSVEAD